MAKTGIWLRGANGKFAGASLVKTNNGTQIREIVTPANPKTPAQQIQRMIFATISIARKQLAAIVDHSFEGVKYGTDSLSRFSKLNIKPLRAAAMREISGDGIETGNFLIKGCQWAQPNIYTLSQGTLTFPQYSYENISATPAASFAKPAAITTAQDFDDFRGSYAEFLALFGLVPGDQVTVIAIDCNPSQAVVANNNDTLNMASVVRYARIVFKKTTNVTKFATAAQNGKVTFNSEIIDTARSSANANEVFIVVNNFTTINKIGWSIGENPDVNFITKGIAVIRSQQNSKGKWLRSNSSMVVDGDITAPAQYTYQTYGNAATENVGSDYYLNNALTSSASDGVTPTIPQVIENLEITTDTTGLAIYDGYDRGQGKYIIDRQTEEAGELTFAFDSNANFTGVSIVPEAQADASKVNASLTKVGASAYFVTVNILSVLVGNVNIKLNNANGTQAIVGIQF